MNENNIPSQTNESLGFTTILKTTDVRVFRPSEVKILLRAIKSETQRIKFEVLLYTGMRYIECKRLLENPHWFDGEQIHLTKKAIRKKKIKVKERYIHLNPMGRMVVRAYLSNKKPLPSYVTWTENLQRWTKKAGLNSDLVSPKSTRKTWESWLVQYYPQYTSHIFLSQGHKELTALEHYVNLPFKKADVDEMAEFVGGIDW